MVPCDCSECSKDRHGFRLQSTRTRLNHTNNDARRASLQRPHSSPVPATKCAQHPAEESQVPQPAKKSHSEAAPSTLIGWLFPSDPSGTAGGYQDFLSDPHNTDDAASSGTLDDDVEQPPLSAGEVNNRLPNCPPDDDTMSLTLPPTTMPLAAIPALKEHPTVRSAYLQAIVGNSFKRMTEDTTEWMLQGTLNLLKSFNLPRPLDPKPPTTLKTVKRRLRIDPDEFIVVQPPCDVCYRPYSADEITNLPTKPRTAMDQNHPQKHCNGLVYRVETHCKKGVISEARVPVKTFPYSAPIPKIR